VQDIVLKKAYAKGQETFDSFTVFMNLKKKRKVMRLCEAHMTNLFFKRTLRRAGGADISTQR
jgi:hypothetical protein